VKLLDCTWENPAENLACDEALLDAAEAAGGPEVLRFWEPRSHFVVLGYGDRAEKEVNVAACKADGVPVLRRSSGGGTVLQGPGCLNYSLILKIDPLGPLRSIVSANRFIMERNRSAIEAAMNGATLVDTKIPEPSHNRDISIRGHTDLTLGELKFSGNAQRRKKSFLLFHGTFLLRFGLPLLEEYLPLPSRQPAYRFGRSHSAFVMNLGLPVERVKGALQAAWNATEPLSAPPAEAVTALVCDKYETNAWIFRI